MRKKNSGYGATVAAVLATLVVAGSAGYMVGQRSGEKLGKADAAVVATVNDQEITNRDLYARFLANPKGLSTLDEMITEKLIEQAADEAKVTVSQAEIDAEISKVKESIGGESEFQAALEAEELTLEVLQQRVNINLMITKILSKDLALDDTALQEYFTANTTVFDKREVKARHILVATVDEANAVKAELDGGADFAEVAKAKSTDTTTKENGGDLGFIKRSSTTLSPTFSDAAFNLKVNEISAPVQTEKGWHVIQVLEAKGTAPEFSTVKEEVRDVMVQNHLEANASSWLMELRDKAKIKNTLEPKA